MCLVDFDGDQRQICYDSSVDNHLSQRHKITTSLSFSVFLSCVSPQDHSLTFHLCFSMSFFLSVFCHQITTSLFFASQCLFIQCFTTRSQPRNLALHLCFSVFLSILMCFVTRSQPLSPSVTQYLPIFPSFDVTASAGARTPLSDV